MSRVAKKEIQIPSSVTYTRDGQLLEFKSTKGSVAFNTHRDVIVEDENNILTFKMKPSKGKRIPSMSLAGTTRARINNILIGLTEGFEAKLLLVGVGYKAQTEGNTLNLSLGYSHPITYNFPAGVEILTPTQTEIIIKGIDKALVGQVAADIRSYREPEPYKGKGIRYGKGKGVKPMGENIILKETKKK
ncbi:MAG: 50S ribosomal protein L6 [Legionellaceae bacterium]